MELWFFAKHHARKRARNVRFPGLGPAVSYCASLHNIPHPFPLPTSCAVASLGYLVRDTPSTRVQGQPRGSPSGWALSGLTTARCVRRRGGTASSRPSTCAPARAYRELLECVEYVQSHRTTDDLFEVVHADRTPGQEPGEAWVAVSARRNHQSNWSKPMGVLPDRPACT